MPSQSKLAIPPPEPGREPLKTNVFQFVQNSVTALAPLFPYVDEGSIVPCAATFQGGSGVRFGRFQHFNTVDEVVIMFGSKGGRGRPGFVRVGSKLHPVGAPFEDQDNPENIRVTTITQRQLYGKPHREEYRFICDKCDRRLYLEEIDATPPRRNSPEAKAAARGPFITIVETYEAAKHFNENEEARRCKHCGHVNPPFPIESWGWDQYVRQADIVRRAQDSIASAQAAANRPAKV